LLKFLKKKSKAVAKGWASVKAALKEIKDEVAAKKMEEAAARKAEEQKVASAEKQELVAEEAGAVIKQTYAEEAGAKTPGDGVEVTAHYTGTLLDGTKFDSSRDRGDPFKFTLGQGQVIKCWDVGFASMKVGEKAVLTCGSEYAYGASGSPPKIPADATLKFDVELISFESKAGKEEL
jgi:FKBP-type peptidyl-prolyl cis-trans isomerase